MGRDTYSESYTSRQEIVPLDESTQAGAKEKPPLPEASSSIGAAYRIRTYDVLIRSQTLYPAEVTPQRKTYKTTLAYWSQAQSQTFLWNAVLSCCSAYTAVPRTIDWLFDHVELGIKFPQERSHPLGTIIIGKRDAQHARDLVGSPNSIEVLQRHKSLVRHKGLGHMRRLLKAPLCQRTLTRLPNHQAAHARRLTRYKQVLPALVALK